MPPKKTPESRSDGDKLKTPFVLSLLSQKSRFFQQELIIRFHLPTGQVLSWILLLWPSSQPTDTQQGRSSCQTPLRQQSMQLTVDCSWSSDQSHMALMPTHTNLRRVPISSEQMCSSKRKCLLNQKHKSWSPTDRIQTESNKTEAWFVWNYDAGLGGVTVY